MTGEWRLSCGDALDFYDTWDTPTTIISDGAYGVGGFPGDPRTPADLPRWYEPHIAAWSAKATLATTLWLWNTEIGWANIHPPSPTMGGSTKPSTFGIREPDTLPET